WREEYERHFLPYWPHAEGDRSLRSWALNGNHDMYSGGHGYFGFLLRDPRFAGQQGSSHFRLAGRWWQLLGLDTAYRDHDLAGCIGHGGVPVLLPDADEPVPSGVRYLYQVPGEVEGSHRWGFFGFVVLDFDGPSVLARYVNQRGDEHHREQLAG